MEINTINISVNAPIASTFATFTIFEHNKLNIFHNGIISFTNCYD